MATQRGAEVEVGNSLVALFLTTVADDTTLNNMDVIVKNNPLHWCVAA